MFHLWFRLVLTSTLCSLLTACMPPTFYSVVNIFAVDNGSDVAFIVKVGNSPSSVTCFNGNVTMALIEADTYQGIADYTNDLGGSVGTTTVRCTATNSYGASTLTVGAITLIENQPPQIVMLSGVTICGNNGSLQIDEPLIDEGSSAYLTGANYLLTQGSLPTGLSINSSNGHLQGTIDSGDLVLADLAITATTVAGSDVSSLFTVTIQEAACP